jgi:hypothetical protein
MKQNFVKTERCSFKKIVKYREVSLKYWIKFAIFFMTWMKVNKIQQIFNKIFKLFQQNEA